MNGTGIRALLFDLDGTLLDTAPDLVAALNRLRADEDLPEVAVADYRHLVSQGALGLIRAGMPDGHDTQRLDLRRRRFLDHYAQNLHVDTRPFEGVPGMLDALSAAGLPWGVVTNKPEFLTLPLLDALGWRQRAAFVIGGDTLAQRKPDPAPILLACELAGVAPARALMVGDDPRDLQAGLAAGTQVALAVYGYGAQEVLDSGQAPELQLATAGELLAVLGLEGVTPPAAP